VELTERCNFHCVYCYANSGPDNTTELAQEITLDIIDQFITQGGETIVISGGEPMLHPEWEKIAAHSCKVGTRVCLATNGSLISRYIEALAGLPLRVLVSLDGLVAKTHESARGRGTLDPVLAGILGLAGKQNRACSLGLNVVVFKSNLIEVPRLIQFALDNGIDYTAFCVLKHQGRNRNQQVQPLNSIERLWLHDYLDQKQLELGEKLRIEGANCGHENFLLESCDAGVYPCWLGRSVKVLPDGRIFACDQAEHPFFCVGNVHTDSLLSALYGEAISRKRSLIAERFAQTPVCRACLIGELCGGGCPSEALDRYGELLAPDGSCDARQLYFISTALAVEKNAGSRATAY